MDMIRSFDGGASHVTGWRVLALAVCAIPSVFVLPSRGQEQAAETRSRMRDVRVAIAQYFEMHHQFPENLQGICPDGLPCRLMPPSNDRRGIRDGWGRPFVYHRLEGDYELTSLGPDGRSGTADDMVFRPSLEQRWATTVHGCYLASSGWWTGFADHVFVLDTAAFYLGSFVLSPLLGGHTRAFWQVPAQDSVVLRWTDVHSIVNVRLRHNGDSLEGIAERPRHRPVTVVARRISCPAKLNPG